MRVLFFILGVLIPLPIFINVLTGEIIIEHSYSYSASYGAPVPIGTFVSFIIGILAVVLHIFSSNGLSRRNIILLNICFSLTILFFIYSLKSVELLRGVSIIVPFALLLFLFVFCKNNYPYRYSMKGYSVGLILFIFLHAVSNIKWTITDQHVSSGLLTNFFGLAIYQALVSYSAVLSYMGCTFVLLFFLEKKLLNRLGYLVIIATVYYVVSFGARKAVILDIVILMASTILVMFWLILTTRRIIFKTGLGVAIAVFMIMIYILKYSSFIEYRELSVEHTIGQRWPMVLLFIETLKGSTIIEVLIGQSGKRWAGYSNFFISLILSLGVLGMLLYFTTLVFWMKLLIRNNLFYMLVKIRNNLIFKIWSLFVVISIIAANIVNMNFQIPYYMLNIVFISLLFINRVENSLSRKVNGY